MKRSYLPILAIIALIAVCAGCAGPSPAATVPPVTAAPTAAQSTDAQATPRPSPTKKEALEAMLDEPTVDFELDTLSGERAKLSDYRGKIVFLSFFTTWCGYCVEEMPHFDALMKNNDDVAVLAVQPAPSELQKAGDLTSDDEQKAERLARDLMEENGFSFPVLLDRDGAVFDDPFYASQGFPTNFVIDRDGVLRVYQPGMLSPENMEIILLYMRALDEP